jgi:ribosomal protein L30/L7E
MSLRGAIATWQSQKARKIRRLLRLRLAMTVVVNEKNPCDALIFNEL